MKPPVSPHLGHRQRERRTGPACFGLRDVLAPSARRGASARATVIGLLLLLASRPLAAQLDLGGAPLPGGDEHWYRRSRSLLETEAADPWRDRLTRPLPARGLHWRPLRAELRTVFNSDRPSPDDNDGVVWAGRGLTASAQTGLEVRWRVLHLQLAPIVFRAENRAFPLLPNGRTDQTRFGDPRFPGNIDAPQRFGDAPYERLDAGDSFLALRALGLTTGLSASRMIWGPAREYPLVLGATAGGFPHLFIGTDGPRHVPFLGVVEGRLIAARLEQSAWSPVQSGESRRFHSGLVLSLKPAIVPWWEVGATRTETGAWPAGGPTVQDALGPLSGVLNAGNTSSLNSTGTNGFASIFTRVAVPGAGLELYGELSWEDFANDARRFLQKIDDLNTYTIGIGRAWIRREALHRLGVESTNGEVSHQERGQRGFVTPFPPYTHAPTFQGLTSNGQFLGSGATYRGSGSTIRYSRQSPAHDLQVRLTRERLLDAIPSDISAEIVTSALGASVHWTWLGHRVERAVSFGYTHVLPSAAPTQPQPAGWQVGVRLRARLVP